MANEITQELINEFKERLKLSDDEDGNLARIMRASVEDLIYKCGAWDLTTSESFKELVYERCRYVYNDALEYFNNNFQSQITNLDMRFVYPEDSISVDDDPEDTDTDDPDTGDTP